MFTHSQKPTQLPTAVAISTFLHYILVACAVLLLLSRPYLVASIRAQNCNPAWLLVGPIIFFALFMTILSIEFFSRQKVIASVYDYIFVLFGILTIAMLAPNLNEYRARIIVGQVNEQLINQFYDHKDARIRALAILASAPLKSTNSNLGALIHRGLLDKDPLVQQAAKLVIENNFEIELKREDDSAHRVSSFH